MKLQETAISYSRISQQKGHKDRDSGFKDDLDKPGFNSTQVQTSELKMIKKGPNLKEKEIHQIYSLYFESDLNLVKSRALEQLQSIQNKQDVQSSQIEQLKLENQQLEKTIKRYRDLVNDPNLKKTIVK